MRITIEEAIETLEQCNCSELPIAYADQVFEAHKMAVEALKKHCDRMISIDRALDIINDLNSLGAFSNYNWYLTAFSAFDDYEEEE